MEEDRITAPAPVTTAVRDPKKVTAGKAAERRSLGDWVAAIPLGIAGLGLVLYGLYGLYYSYAVPRYVVEVWDTKNLVEAQESDLVEAIAEVRVAEFALRRI